MGQGRRSGRAVPALQPDGDLQQGREQEDRPADDEVPGRREPGQVRHVNIALAAGLSRGESATRGLSISDRPLLTKRSGRDRHGGAA